MTIFTYTSWRTNVMKKKITKAKITEEDKAEFNEAVGLCDEILGLLHDRLANHSLDSIIYQSTFSLARALSIVANAAEQATGDDKGLIKEQCIRIMYQLMYNTK